MRLLWLADVLRSAGLEVVEHDGWQSRGRELQYVDCIVCHHTVTRPSASDAAVCRLLINGRAGLPGPLSNLGLDRQGRYHLIAAGKANHNGYGLHGNQTIGIEAFNDGEGEPWLAVQMDAYYRGCAAICRHLGWPAQKVLAHKETDPKRKPFDPRFDMTDFRRSVAALIAPPPIPEPEPPAEEDDDMKRIIYFLGDDAWLANYDQGTTVKASGPSELTVWRASGFPEHKKADGEPRTFHERFKVSTTFAP